MFVEKPLCITQEELAEIKSCYARCLKHNKVPLLMVGFNRRYAPLIKKIKSLIQNLSGPKAFVMSVNAGKLPKGHWTQDSVIGGNRIVGEACHFIDLLRFLAGTRIISHKKVTMNNGDPDTVSIALSFDDGSIGTVNYFTNGVKSFPKERLEVFADQHVLQLDNFCVLRGYGFKKFRVARLWRQDKGQKECVAAFLDAIQNRQNLLIPVEEIFEVSEIAISLSR